MLLVIGAAAWFAQAGVRRGDDYYTPPRPMRMSAVHVPPAITWPMPSGQANHNTTMHDMVTNIDENQDAGGGCGSCWAWSITTAVEARVAQQKGHIVSLSPQQLVDCTRNVAFGGNMGAMSNEGCAGGYTEATVEWMKMTRYGMCQSANYPYTGQDGSCTACTGHVRIDDFEVYPRYVQTSPGVYTQAAATEDSLAQMVSKGPTIALLSIANATSFSHGDTSDTTCTAVSGSGEPPLHSVVVYGYTASEWLVYNSYGNAWGPHGDGTARIARGSNAYCIGSLKHLRISDVSMIETTQVEPSSTVLNVHISQPVQDHTHASLDSDWGVASVVFIGVLLLCLAPLACYPTGTTEHRQMQKHRRRYDNRPYEAVQRHVEVQVVPASALPQRTQRRRQEPSADLNAISRTVSDVLGADTRVYEDILPAASGDAAEVQRQALIERIRKADAARRKIIIDAIESQKRKVPQHPASREQRWLSSLAQAASTPQGTGVRCACGSHELIKAALQSTVACNVCHKTTEPGRHVWTCSRVANPCDYHMCGDCYVQASS